MKISLLGSGNVATHLGDSLAKAGHEIVQVFSRRLDHAKQLALQLNAEAINDIQNLNSNADVYIIAVTDDSISEVAQSIPFRDKLVIHTSGSTEMEIPGISGVFYPIQTFSKQKQLDFSKIPIAIEAKDENVKKMLLELGQSVSSKVLELDSEKRKALHVAAVFACNFTNHFYTLAEDILSQRGLDFSLVRPLILETAQKVMDNNPADVQTGPAVRNNQGILDKHLTFLKNDLLLVELYRTLSQSIINFEQKR